MMLTSSPWPGVLTFVSKQHTYDFVLMIDHTLLSMFCSQFINLWKSIFSMNPPYPLKTTAFEALPPSPLEFPAVCRGRGGKDIF